MQQPTQEVDKVFEQLLQDLPAEIIEMAYEFKAFARSRKIKTVEELLRVVFLYSGLDKSLREVAGNLTLTSEEITDTAIAKRLEACRPWIKAVLPKMLKLETVKDISKEKRLLIIDGSQIQSPGAKCISYYLHICMDLISLEFVEIKITDKHTTESLYNFSLASTDIVIADRGYCHPAKMSETLKKGANLIVRISANNVPLYKNSGEKLNLVEELKSQPYQTIQSFEVTAKDASGKHQAKGWLHAYRLSEEQAAEARRKARKKSNRAGETPKESTLFLAGWVLVFSSLTPQEFSARVITDLYRIRWQIEIAIKRWKSLLDVGQLRAKENSPLAELWLYGKMLYALMLEKRARRKVGDTWSYLDSERSATWWRIWKTFKDEVEPLITKAAFWSQDSWQQCLNVLKERSRRRTLQRLSSSILQELNSLNSFSFLNAA